MYHTLFVAPSVQSPWYLIQPCLFWTSHWLPARTLGSTPRTPAQGPGKDEGTQTSAWEGRGWGEASVYRRETRKPATGKKRERWCNEVKGARMSKNACFFWNSRAQSLLMGPLTPLWTPQSGWDTPSPSLPVALTVNASGHRTLRNIYEFSQGWGSMSPNGKFVMGSWKPQP